MTPTADETNEAERFPTKVEELLGFVVRHVASELGVERCPPPLEESLRVYTRAVIAATRTEHEHPTPVVHASDFPTTIVADKPEYRATLPTEPPAVDYSDPPQRRVGQSLVPTNRGFPRRVEP